MGTGQDNDWLGIAQNKKLEAVVLAVLDGRMRKLDAGAKLLHDLVRKFGITRLVCPQQGLIALIIFLNPVYL